MSGAEGIVLSLDDVQLLINGWGIDSPHDHPNGEDAYEAFDRIRNLLKAARQEANAP